MYALIRNGTITQLGALPRLYWDGTRWHDWQNPDTTLRATDPAACGWFEVTETPRPADTTEGTHDGSVELVAGVPTRVWTYRDFTIQEVSTQSQLTDLTTRVARIEAHLWPADPEPEEGADPVDYPEFMGIWDNGAIIRETGRLWRNISGVPLTTPPSGFPGIPAQWGHLFVEVNAVPADPEPGVPEWSPTATYTVGDLARRDGVTYRCLVAHGAAYQGTWGPPTTGVWAVA